MVVLIGRRNYATNLGVNSQEYYPTLTGWYEVRITYTLYGVTLTKKVRTKYTILETVNLPNGQKWYITTSN